MRALQGGGGGGALERGLEAPPLVRFSPPPTRSAAYDRHKGPWAGGALLLGGGWVRSSLNPMFQASSPSALLGCKGAPVTVDFPGDQAHRKTGAPGGGACTTEWVQGSAAPFQPPRSSQLTPSETQYARTGSNRCPTKLNTQLTASGLCLSPRSPKSTMAVQLWGPGMGSSLFCIRRV